ncbi:MAG TPA: flippase-like domain-containing protein [Chloroflexota bacterium]
MSRLPLVAAVTVIVSVISAGAAILSMYNPHAVLHAIARADVSLLACAIAVGGISQVLRAQRVAVIMRARYSIPLDQTFGARVLSHAVGSFLPLGPAHMGVEGLLLRRLARIPVAYSAGVLAACGVLDHLSMIPLLTFVLVAMHLPEWLRLILLGTMLQSVVSLLVPLFAASTRSRLSRLAFRSRWQMKIQTAISQIEDGLAEIVSGGWRIVVPALALSLLLSAVSILRLALLLAAFELQPSPHQLVLLLLMAGMLGSVPVQIPGANLWATGKLMRLIHLLGPGAGAFVLLSGVIAMVEAPILALVMLAWWALPRSRVTLRLNELVAVDR